MRINVSSLIENLETDESLELKPYRDTEGKLTIGIGRNLDDRGITENEARFLLNTDLEIVFTELDRKTPWWRSMPEPAQRGLANMCFNLGWPRLSGFKKMLTALASEDYSTAALEALDSKWARQVGDRAVRISELFKVV